MLVSGRRPSRNVVDPLHVLPSLPDPIISSQLIDRNVHDNATEAIVSPSASISFSFGGNEDIDVVVEEKDEETTTVTTGL